MQHVNLTQGAEVIYTPSIYIYIYYAAYTVNIFILYTYAAGTQYNIKWHHYDRGLHYAQIHIKVYCKACHIHSKRDSL